MRKLNLCLLTLLFSLAIGMAGHDAAAAKEKIKHKRADFTAEQRAALLEKARKLCKKRYGAASTVYRLDYYKWMVICT
jgi:hypothetical protein